MIPTTSMSEDKGIDWRIEAQSQAAGTPNQAGIAAFVPLSSEGFYFDGIAKASFSDIGNYSSLKDTKVSGIGASSSLRIMYIMLNELFRSILVHLKVVNYSSALLEIYLCLTESKQNKQKQQIIIRQLHMS